MWNSKELLQIHTHICPCKFTWICHSWKDGTYSSVLQSASGHTDSLYQSMCKHQMQMQSLHHRRPSQSLYVREIRCLQHSRITCAWQPLQSRSECVWQGVHGRLSHCTSQLWPSLKTLWIKCGVLQYSVLSSIHFILVVDPLLAELKGSRNICIASLDPICEH